MRVMSLHLGDCPIGPRHHRELSRSLVMKTLEAQAREAGASRTVRSKAGALEREAANRNADRCV